MRGNFISFFLFFIYFLSFVFAKPSYIVSEKIFKDLKSDLKIRKDSYFLIKYFNSVDRYSFIFFDDHSKKIYLVEKKNI